MKPIIVANWKCNPSTLEEAKQLFNSIKEGLAGVDNAEAVIASPFVYISDLSKDRGDAVKLCAQNVFWEEKGAFTGEISPKMLKGLGVDYVILGHSERRKYVKETDMMINKKLKKALEFGLIPILCIGDKKRESENDIKEVEVQLKKDIKGLDAKALENVIFAYEPVWAISTTKGGKPATIDDARNGVVYMRKILQEMFGSEFSGKIRVIYGGSVNSQNVEGFIKAGIDGGLVGAASLKPDEFVNMVKNARR